MKTLADFTADLLSECGGLVENADSGLEVLLPPDAASLLELPEHARLSFSADGEEGILVSYESDLFKNMGRLLNSRGRFCIVNLPVPSPVNMEKLQERLGEKVALWNAVFHLEKTEQKRISYLLAYFKYTALSDERREGIIASLINEFNLSVRRLEADLSPTLVNGIEGSLDGVDRKEVHEIFKSLYRAQREIAKETLQDFIKSLERRLNRDIQRVNDYYRTLVQETRLVIEKKTFTGEEREKAQSKIEAIETEQRWKIQDLIAKYHLTIQLEPITFVRIETEAPTFWLMIKRRKGTRSFPLTYNPILRALDSFPCEACYSPQKPWSLCDDRLHIVCNRCFKACPKCGKEYCAACHPLGCPRCGPLS